MRAWRWVLLTITVAILVSVAASRALVTPRSEPKSLEGFECRQWGNEPFPTGCSLSDKSSYLGMSLGMDAKHAFYGLCSTAKNAAWSERAKSDQGIKLQPKRLRCDDWLSFGESTFWALHSEGYPCAQRNITSIHLRDGHVVSIYVLCLRKIVCKGTEHYVVEKPSHKFPWYRSRPLDCNDIPASDNGLIENPIHGG